MAEGKRSVDVNAVASEQYIDSLKRRLDVLEKKLIGQGGVREGQPALKSTIELIDQRLKGLAKVGGSIPQAWSKIDTLEKVLSPEYTSYLKLSEDSKAELLLGYQEQLEPLSKQVDEVQKLKDYLNTTEFQGLDNQEKKLAAVASVHSQQELQVEALSKQIRGLMQAYHKIVLQLSAQCVEWDETVSRLESQS